MTRHGTARHGVRWHLARVLGKEVCEVERDVVPWCGGGSCSCRSGRRGSTSASMLSGGYGCGRGDDVEMKTSFPTGAAKLGSGARVGGSSGVRLGISMGVV